MLDLGEIWDLNVVEFPGTCASSEFVIMQASLQKKLRVGPNPCCTSIVGSAFLRQMPLLLLSLRHTHTHTHLR